MLTLQEVRAKMLAKAKTSCLTTSDVKLLQFEPYTEDHELEIYPRFAGFKIPYFLLNGKPDPSFYRFRFVQTQPSKGFAAITEEPKKPRRYSQPMGTQCGVYLPPLLDASWAEIAKNPAISVVITEGELKAACGCKFGFPTIGLGGVYNWRSAKDNQELLPILEKFIWEGRKVTICFDSDTKDNPMVRMAASRLAYTLAVRGAIVTWAQLPEAEEGAKQGLDDFVFIHGAEALAELMSKESEDLGPGRELHRLNTEVAVIHSTGEVVELHTGLVWTQATFADTIYRNRTYSETDANNRMIKKFAAKEWLSIEGRTEVAALAYAPACNNLITESGAYNMWYPQRWPIQPSKKGTMAPWEELFKHIFGHLAPEHQVWVRQWFAYPIQKPGTKLTTAILVWGRQTGTGKTKIGSSMKAIYGKNYHLVENDQLGGQFNEWAVNKQFIVGDEILTGDKRAMGDKLKSMISRDSVTINIKNRKTYSVDDCINYFFTSNHEDAIYMEAADRRIFVCHADIEAKPESWYTAYQCWLDEEGGAERLFHYLRHEVDCSNFNPKGRAPKTREKEEMIESGRGDTELWASHLAKHPDEVLKATPYDLYTVEELLRVYDPEERQKTRVGGLGKALNAAGIFKVAGGSNNIVIDGVRRRLYAVRNAEKYKRVSPSEARRMYDAERPAKMGNTVGSNQKFAQGKRIQ
jgi:hypothetical protein